jgi:Tfp pilus assembly protein PilV
MRHAPNHRGSTLVEVLVALTLLTLGLLGVTGTALAAHRLLDGGRWATRLALAGTSRLEALRAVAADSAACRAAHSGTRILGPAAEQWSATPAGSTLRLQSILQRPVRGSAPAETLRVAVWCP